MSNTNLEEITVDKVLFAVGRVPNVEGMGLEEAKVEYSKSRGIKVNDELQTTNSSIYAVGDCTPHLKFTHNSDIMARMVIKNALTPLPSQKYSQVILPYCTYTTPEIAHVGKYEHELEAEGVKFETLYKHFDHCDRALCEGVEGMIKVSLKEGTD